MKVSILVMLLVFAVAPAAVAQVDCSSFETAIDNSLKLISMERASGIADNSAPRETMRAAKIANHLQVISINPNLMKEHKCPR